MKKIGFIGIGKLGLDCAEVMAEKHEVRGYDIYPRTSNSVKVCDINELVNESEWIFIAVPTPHAEGYDGSVPSSHMEPRDFGHDAVIDAINKVNTHAQSSKKVVLISTVLPGTTRKHFRHPLPMDPEFDAAFAAVQRTPSDWNAWTAKGGVLFRVTDEPVMSKLGFLREDHGKGLR